MENEALQMLTSSNLMTTGEVLLAFAALVIVLDKVVDIIKKWRTPATSTDQKLANDKVRLDNHEAEIRELKEGGRLQGEALIALLDHELHNGNSQQMEAARDNLLGYYMKK